MEIIAPYNKPSNQSLNLNDPNNQTDSNQSEQKNLLLKFIGFINSFIFELVLIGLFSVIILITLNYFNIIPISSVFPALSFLPQQNSVQKIINTASQDDISFFNNNFPNLASCDNSNIDNSLILNQIISCTNPQKFINSNVKNETDYQVIPNTDDPGLIGDKGVQINLALKAQTNGKDDTGIMFGGDSTENRFYIAYYPQQNAWGIQFLFGNKVTEFIPIYTPSSISNAQRAFFSVKVAEDEKTISIIFPNGVIYSYSSDKNFYTKAGSLPITIVLYKNSNMFIYNLNYYTPQ